MLHKDIEIFNNCCIPFDSNGVINDLYKRLNETLDDWEKVKVPLKHYFTDELIEVTEYTYHYILRVSKIYELLGYEPFDLPVAAVEWYYEKDENGNLIHGPYD